MKQILVGIDIGSTNLKCVAFESNGRVVAQTARSMIDFYHEYSGQQCVYADHNCVYRSVASMLREICSTTPAYEIAALSVTGMGDDVVPLGKDGKVLYPFISWKCKRTLPYFDRFRETFGFERYFMITGLQARNMDTIFKIQWMREHEPELYHQAVRWLFIEDYIVFRLCGTACTDYSIASTSGLLDLAENTWSREIAEFIGLDVATMPELVHAGTQIGSVSRQASVETGVPEGTCIVQGGWDIQCAALSLGGIAANSVIDTMGTWETINIIAERPMLTQEFYQKGFHVCNHVLPGLYSYPVFLLSSGIVEWYLDAFYNDFEDGKRYTNLMEDIAHSPLGANGVMFLPHLSGSFFPQINPRALGAFLGLSEQVCKADFSRALIEGLCYMTCEVVNVCEQILHEEMREMVVTGGGVRNAQWMQIKADVFNRVLLLSDNPEDTALGAAMLAGLGCGTYKSVEEALISTRSVRREVTPNKLNVETYSRLLSLYRGLDDDLEETNRRLFVNRDLL